MQVADNERGHIDTIRKFELTVEMGRFENGDNGKLRFFAYLPKIPLADQTYSIGVVEKNRKYKRICDVDGSNFFIDTLISAPPSGSHYYFECDLKTQTGGYNDTIRVDAIAK